MTSRGSVSLSRIGAKLPAASIVSGMRKSGCSVKLDRLNRHRLIVDLDRHDSPGQQTRCDFIFVSDQLLVAPIELKRGKVEAADAKRQLQAGSDLVNSRIIPGDIETELKPLAFSKGIDRAQRELLRRSSHFVRYRGRDYEIAVRPCGSSLADALR